MSGLMVKVLEHFYGGDESKISAIDYLGMKPAPVPSLPGGDNLVACNHSAGDIVGNDEGVMDDEEGFAEL